MALAVVPDFYDAILARLAGVVPTRTGWAARCPAHDDHRPSLHVAIGRDGQLLLYCQSQHCAIEAICAALGVALGDLFPNREALRLARKQARKQQHYRELMADADLYRSMHRMVVALRSEATRLGPEDLRAWNLLDHAASLEREALHWDMTM